MKLLIVLSVFAFLIGSSLAIQEVLCRRDFCIDYKCDEYPKTQEDCAKEQALDPNAKFVLTEKASFCGCCSVCMRILKEGQDCSSMTFGRVIKSRCEEGTECNQKTHKCDPLMF